VSISEDYKLNCLVLEFLYFICQVASARRLQSNFVVFKSSCHYFVVFKSSCQETLWCSSQAARRLQSNFMVFKSSCQDFVVFKSSLKRLRNTGLI